MNFRFSLKRGRPSRRVETPTFTVKRLWTQADGREVEVSHLIDRTYRYRSARELKWHLADRFGLPIPAVELRQA